MSPYLPAGAELSSGYRGDEKQRKILYDKYKGFKADIIDKYGKDEFADNVKKMDEKMTDSEVKEPDVKLHTQICKAVHHQNMGIRSMYLLKVLARLVLLILMIIPQI